MATGFWSLEDSAYSRPAEWDESVDFEQVTCPFTSDHQGPGDRIGPLRIVLPSARIGDFVWTWLNDCIIQDRVLRRSERAGFTGFATAPVEVAKVRLRHRSKPETRQELPRLWELRVTGWGGEAHPESGIRMRYYCEGCGTTEYTKCENPASLIDPAQWDGSDFFIVWPLPKYIFITDRVAELIREEGYTGVRLMRAEELDFTDSTGFSPGPLPAGRRLRGPADFPDTEVRRA